MRVSYLIGALIVIAPIGLCTGLEPANAFDFLFGTRRPYEGAWCARTNTGAGRVEEDCIFDSFEACRRTVISGNRGFCTPNPAFVGKVNTSRKRKRDKPQ